MDGSLSSSRYDDQEKNERGSYSRYQSHNDGRHHNRRGRGGGGAYRDNRRGGGYGRGGYRDDRRHQAYHRRGGGGGRGRSSPGNRFDNSTVTQSVDPQTAMMKQLTAMIAKMGDLIPAAESAASLNDDANIGNNDGDVRPVMKAIAKNIEDLVGVLCNAQNAPLFLKYQNSVDNASSVIAEDEAGPMATLVTSCAATLPLSSPSYAGLTLAVEVNAPDASPDTANVSYRGFAQRCITMACRRLMADLDKACGVIQLVSQEGATTNGDDDGNSNGDTYVQAFMRSKLLLRYFALLTRAGIMAKDYDSDVSMESFSDASTLSLAGLLNVLVESASHAQKASLDKSSAVISDHSLMNISVILAMLALSTIPYALQCLSQDFVNNILSKVTSLMEKYTSPFLPGTGIMAILMEKEQHDVFNPDKDNDDDDDEEEEESVDEEDSSPVCADTFQDLLRTVKKLADTFYECANVSTRFALLTDEPWVGLQGKQEEHTPMEDGSDGRNVSSALIYKGEKLRFSITEECQTLKYFMNLDSSDEMETAALAFQRPSLEGLVFGRLSIFDPPPEDDDDDDDDVAEPNIATYIKTFSHADRFFLSDSVRDCLICHRCTVTKAGITQGSVKDVAMQIWSISELFNKFSDSGENTDDSTTFASRGFECGVVETILALLSQAPRGIESSCAMTHVYLSRVLIELIKYQPSTIPKSLAVAVSDIFNDFIPSLSPISKENLSYWFAFHLVNTDYQWPSAHWNAWAPYAVEGMEGMQRNCRGEFVLRVIDFMTSFESNPEVIVNVCLPSGNKLSTMIISEQKSADTIKSSSFQTAIDNIENDLINRMWKNNDDADDIQTYILGEETSETVHGSMDDDLESSTSDHSKLFWRTGLIMRSLLDPSSCYRLRMISKIKKSIQEDEGNQGLHFMDDEISDNPKEDVITDMIDLVDRYKSVLLSCLAKDIQIYEENLDFRGESKVCAEDMLLMGESFILSECEKKLGFAYSIFSASIECFIRNKIISPKGVLTWCLGSSNINRGATIIGRSWWNIASFAICLGIDSLLSDSYSKLSADVGMIIDTGRDDGSNENVGTASARRIKKVNDFLVPLLQFAASQVKSFIQANNTDIKQKTISHSEADMREGLKFLLRSTLSHAALCLMNDEIVKINSDLGGSTLEVSNWIAKVALNDVGIIS